MSYRPARMLSLLALLSLLASVFLSGQEFLAAQPVDDTQSRNLVPLPRSCGGFTPKPGEPAVCCIWGYVFLEGRPIAGATVRVVHPAGSFETKTELLPDRLDPHFQMLLRNDRFRIEPGETVKIVVEYDGQQVEMDYVVRPDSQRVDLLLPRDRIDDYVFDRQIWQQAPAGSFNSPRSITRDGVGNLYVADALNARVQVFSRDGLLLDSWGTLGNEPGQMGEPEGVALDGKGYVYVSDAAQARVHKFTTTGDHITSWGERGPDDNPRSFGVLIDGLAVDAEGFVYVVDTYKNRIAKFSGEGEYVGQIPRKADQMVSLDTPEAVFVDSTGKIYVADTHNHRIVVFTTEGEYLAVIGGQGANPGQFSFPQGITVDNQGAIYVVDQRNNRVQQFDRTGTFLKSWGTRGAGAGQLLWPESVVVDNEGNLYIADTLNNRVQKFSPGGAALASWGRRGDAAEQLAQVADVAADSAGNLYVTDSTNNLVKKFSPTGALLAKWGGLGFNSPAGIAVDSAGNIYVADRNNHRIVKLNNRGEYVWQLGRLDNLPGDGDGEFSYPMDVAIDFEGSIYVADTMNNRIQKFLKDGQWWRKWGGPGRGEGKFDRPHGIALDHLGYVYVADTYNHRIQQFRINGVYLNRWGSLGNENGQFQYPTGIAVDTARNVYVSQGVAYLDEKGFQLFLDPQHHRIQKFTEKGEFTERWGASGTGPRQFNLPSGLVVTPRGDVAVADTYNQRVQIFRKPEDQVPLPIATIVSVDPPSRSVMPGTPLEFVGQGVDSDATPGIKSYEWTLEYRTGDPPAKVFATGPEPSVRLSTDDLPEGFYTVSLRVRNNENVNSLKTSVTFRILGPPDPSQQTWTFLLYLAGDNDLEPYLGRGSIGALARVQRLPLNRRVRFMVQYDGDQENGGDSVRLEQQTDGKWVEHDLGEVNMGDPRTLAEFIRWGQEQAPADHYYLAIADHAHGLDGIAEDGSTVPKDYLSNGDLQRALFTSAVNATRPIDVLHLDGCLMGLLEVAYQVRDLADYLIVSENLGWSAFAYDSYSETIGAQTGPETLATTVVDRYAERVTEALSIPYTLSALRVDQVNQVTLLVDELAEELLRYLEESPDANVRLAALRAAAQQFDSNGDEALTTADEFVDLDHWAEGVATQIGDPAVQGKAKALRNALETFVVHERHSQALPPYNGTSLDHARGVAIYYPQQLGVSTYQQYARGELLFPHATRWDEFLAATLTGGSFNATPRRASLIPTLSERKVFLPMLRR